MGLLFTLVWIAGSVDSSLVGPWFRYPCDELGFEILVAHGWRVTPLPHGVVFAMQYAPEPYVRVAVGRLAAEPGVLETLVASRLQQTRHAHVRKDGYSVDGRQAMEVEGTDDEGPFRDVFVKKDRYVYWIGFTAERQELWPHYSRTFDIIVDGFHFR